MHFWMQQYTKRYKQTWPKRSSEPSSTNDSANSDSKSSSNSLSESDNMLTLLSSLSAHTQWSAHIQLLIRDMSSFIRHEPLQKEPSIRGRTAEVGRLDRRDRLQRPARSMSAYQARTQHISIDMHLCGLIPSHGERQLCIFQCTSNWGKRYAAHLAAGCHHSVCGVFLNERSIVCH